MAKTLDIALNDLRLILKDKGIFINLVIIPIVISLAVGFANGASADPTPSAPAIRIDVIDSDRSELSESFVRRLRQANSNFVLCPIDQTEADACAFGNAELTPALAQERLQETTSLALIEIPQGFEAQISSGEGASIVYRANEDASAPSYILQAVNAVVQRMGGSLLAARVGTAVADDLAALEFSDDADRTAFTENVRQRADALWSENLLTVDYVISDAALANEPTPQQVGFGQSITGIGTMYAMLAILPAAAAFLQERKNWTIQRLVTMPLTRAQILGGKLLARFAIGIVQYAIIFTFGMLLGVRFGDDPLALLLVMIAFTLCVTALTLALTTLLDNPNQAAGLTLFISLTLAPLGGAWWPLEIVPGWMRTVGHISPVAWAMDGYRSLLFYNGDLSTVIVPVLVLLGMAAVFFLFGVVRFKFD